MQSRKPEESKNVDLYNMSADQLAHFIEENQNITLDQFSGNEEAYVTQLSLVEAATQLLKQKKENQDFEQAAEESARLFNEIESKKNTTAEYAAPATKLLIQLEKYLSKESIEILYSTLAELTESANHNASLGQTVNLSDFENYIKQLKAQLKECENAASHLRQQQEAKQAEEAAAAEHKKYSTHHGFFSNYDRVPLNSTDGGLNIIHKVYNYL